MTLTKVDPARVIHLVALGTFWGILLGLSIDIAQREMGQPITYKAEIAQAQEVQPEEAVEVLIETKIDWTKERIREEVDKKALEYGGDSDRIWRVLMCESGASTTIQSHHILKGVREESYGLVQIHLPSHPHITKEQAIDPEFAIDYIAKHLTNGTDRWSCK
jgi:hypothetical protein